MSEHVLKAVEKMFLPLTYGTTPFLFFSPKAIKVVVQAMQAHENFELLGHLVLFAQLPYT